jgi:hypothetical protein
VLRRAKHPHARDRVIARQDHHFHQWRVGGVRCLAIEGQQFLHQRKSHTSPRWVVHTLQLQLHVGVVVAGFKNAVLFFKVKECARRNRHHQLAVKRHRHAFDHSQPLHA